MLTFIILSNVLKSKNNFNSAIVERSDFEKNASYAFFQYYYIII